MTLAKRRLTTGNADVAHGTSILLAFLERWVAGSVAVVAAWAAVAMSALVTLIVHTGEYKHVQQQQGAAYSYCNTQCCRVRCKPILLKHRVKIVWRIKKLKLRSLINSDITGFISVEWKPYILRVAFKITMACISLYFTKFNELFILM